MSGILDRVRFLTLSPTRDSDSDRLELPFRTTRMLCGTVTVGVWTGFASLPQSNEAALLQKPHERAGITLIVECESIL